MKTTSYLRVIPRDLFNESKLLKCLGQISLLIHDGKMKGATLEHDDSEFAGFQIEQNQDSGALYCSNLTLYVKGERIGLNSRYNSKAAFPLFFEFRDEEQPAFNDDGTLSAEFTAALETINAS